MEKFKIMIASDEEHEKVVAEIFIDGKFAALVNQDEGPEKLQIEFPGSSLQEDMLVRKVDFNDFTKSLEMARKKLLGEG